MTTFNLGNVGDLTKPATVLIEKIFHAAGVLWEPKQMVSIAQAQAKVDMIRAMAKIERDELLERTAKRLVCEELRKQNNMESIIGKAIPALSEEAKPGDIEDDWIANFFDKCRLISDEEMQALWAKILAGQANTPGKFSKRTVNIVASLDRSDAEAFTTLCGFAIKILQGHPLPLIYDSKHRIYTDNGISFFGLTNLESIGLIRFDTARLFTQRTVLLILPYAPGILAERAMHQVPVFYYGQRVNVELPQKEDPALIVGTVILTEPGQQLALVCDAHPVNGFIEYLKEKWKSFGYKVEP